MPHVEQPRSEPEIITPDQAHKRTFFRNDRGNRIYVARITPLGAIFGFAVAVILVSVLLVMLLATVLIWLPLLAAFTFGAIIAGLLRGYFRQTYRR
jgi:hypothetical protein